MIASEPTTGPGSPPAGAGPDPDPAARDDGPVTTLRGAGVDVDPRRAAQLVVAVCVVALAVGAVILLIAGIQKNDQADNLRHHGVTVAVTVTGCSGLLGGSGSNAAGYACRGTYTLDGHHYQQDIPGSALLKPGSVIHGVTVPGDPGLLSTPSLVASQRASWTVYIAPAVLFVAFGLALWLLVVLRRRRGRGPGVAAPTVES
jgi:hypothetical protein